MRKRYLILFLLSLIACAVSAQWSPVGITDGLNNAHFEAIDVFGQHNGKLYSHTFLKGLQVSTDQGSSWTTVNATGLSGSPRQFVSHGSRIYIFGFWNTWAAGMIHYSDDEGETWAVDTVGMPSNQLYPEKPASFHYAVMIDDYIVASLAKADGYYRRHIDSTEWNIIPFFAPYDPTGMYAGNDTVWAFSLAGFWYSVDAGETWTSPANNGFPGALDFGPTLMFKDGETIYLAGNGSFGNPNRIMVTTDRGENWSEITSIGPELGSNAFGSTAVIRSMFAKGQDIWVGKDNDATNTNTDILYSSDGGSTWQEDTVGLPQDPFGTYVIAGFHQVGGYLVAHNNFRDCYKKAISIGVRESERRTFELYPNPATDWVRVEVEGQILSAEAIDILGRAYPLDLKGEGQIDISHLEQGSYVLRLRTGHGYLIERMEVVSR